MSIYATHWILRFPRHGDAHTGCEWIEVFGQGVPAHIGSPSPGCGYEAGDPYSDFLPPAIAVTKEDEWSGLRAMVVVHAGTEKQGQRYIDPLLVLSGREYAEMPFHSLHERICAALRGGRPRYVGEVGAGDGTVRLMFEDGSTRDLAPAPDGEGEDTPVTP